MPNIDFFAAFSLLLISLPLLFELHKWAMEEYCVGKYKNKEGGVLLVSKGFFSSSIKEMPITNLSPSISSFEYDYNIFYFIFRVFTGQRFQTVSIFSDTKFFLKTVRMDPGFAKAISTVKGHVPKQESGGFDSARLEGVLTSLSNGLIDKGRAQELAQIILES